MAPSKLSAAGAESVQEAARVSESVAADSENVELRREAEKLSVDLPSQIIGHLHGNLCVCVCVCVSAPGSQLA